jgi:O-antigen/teichoic acid export membrane protein
VLALEDAGRLWRWAGLLGRFASVQVVVQAVGFLAGIILIRNLSVEQYAYFTIANSIQGTYGVLTDVGMTASLTALGGRTFQDRARLGRLLATALGLRRQMAIWVIAVTTPLLLWMLREAGAPWWSSLLILTALLLGLRFTLDVATLVVVLRLRQEISRLQWLELAGSATRLGLVLLALSSWLDAFMAVLAAAFAGAAQWVLLRRWVAGSYDVAAPPDAGDRRALLKMVRSQAPNGVFFCLQGQITVWLISAFGTQRAIAEVGALGRLGALFAVIGAVTTGIVLPRFARYHGRSMLRRRYTQAVAAQLAFGAVVVLGVLAFPREAVWVLGGKYAHLGHDATYVAAAAVLSSLLALMWHMNAYRGWVPPSWVYIPATLGTQVAVIPLLDLSTVRGVILFGLLSTVPAVLISAFLAARGLREEPPDGAPSTSPP